MIAGALARPRAGAGPWRPALAVLGVAAIAALILFGSDVQAMASLWWWSSTYEHCLLVLPIVAALVWARRRELARLTPVGWAPGLLLVAAAALVWLVGAVGGAAMLRHAGLVGMVIGLVVASLGPAVARGLAFPLLYLIFLVPVGEAWEQPLQILTAHWAGWLLHLTGVPARVDGVFLTTPAGLFEVAEACSGVKFLLAMIALATLAADLGFRSWPRRVILVLVAAVLPVAANALRAWGTMAIAERIGAARAGGFDHVVYGWFFFGAVIAAMLAAAWPFFDRDPAEPAFDPAALARHPARFRMAPAAAALAALTAMAAAWGWSEAIDARSPPLLAAHTTLPDVPGWRRAGPLDGDWHPRFAGADRLLEGRYVDAAGDGVEVATAVFARQTRSVSAVGYGQGATPPGGGWTWNGALGPGASRIAGPAGEERDVASRFVIAGRELSSETRLKMEALRLNLMGEPTTTVAVLVASDERRGGMAAVERFRRAMGPLAPLAARLTGR